ncbi:hypothetical protein [Brucella sp. IR073]|uniref:hypothetical protein n=1 Tax=unclassified Brucella TaxID=2632610 RepID=UPI003B982AF2
MSEWRPISEALCVRYGTVADVKMPSGRVYRAVWGFRGMMCAWWPRSNQRKSAIGQFAPVEFRVVADGILPVERWEDAAMINHAAV